MKCARADKARTHSTRPKGTSQIVTHMSDLASSQVDKILVLINNCAVN